MQTEGPVVMRRDDLYELVWTEPVRSVARCHGISDVALALTVLGSMLMVMAGVGRWLALPHADIARIVAIGMNLVRIALPGSQALLPLNLRMRRAVHESERRSRA